MGKHGTEYERIERDFYPTPPWVIAALAEHVDLRGLTVWEPACGDGRMVEALRQQGCARVYASDIVDYGAGQVFDFLSGLLPPKLERPPEQSSPIHRSVITTLGWRLHSSRLGSRTSGSTAESSRSCCPWTLIPRQNDRAIFAIARNSSARLCSPSASSGSKTPTRKKRAPKRTRLGFCGSAARSALAARRILYAPANDDGGAR
jgi:hypothetical protein